LIKQYPFAFWWKRNPVRGKMNRKGALASRDSSPNAPHDIHGRKNR